MVQWLIRLPTPNAGGPGLILGWGTKSHMLHVRGHMLHVKGHMLQLRGDMLQLKILLGAMKTEDPVCHN